LANDIKLGNSKPVDKHLRPLKVDGEPTSLETSSIGNGSRVTGDLEVSGDLNMGSKGKINSNGNSLVLNAGTVTNETLATMFIYSGDTYGIIISGIADVFKITSNTDYQLLLASLGTGDVVLDSNGDIVLDSADGNFIAKKDGTEFSSANSAYAGMILGYTAIGLNEAHATFNLTTSYVVPTDEFDVEFTAPPSGNVMIEVQIQAYAGTGGLGDLFAGLSTANATSGYAALQAYHEKIITDGDGRYAIHTARISWTLTGLTAGSDYQYWVGFKSTSTSGIPKIQWGGNATGRYPEFIMKATALPATIAT